MEVSDLIWLDSILLSVRWKVFLIRWDHTREILTSCDAGRVVDVSFVEDGSCGCVTVTETFDAEDIHDLDMQKAGRQAILDNFKKCCEEK
jgi:hypothetical protein